MTFNFHARYVLVTYAQSEDLDGFAVSDHFTELGAECIVARETHADSGFHLHAFVDFGRKFRSRNARIFDVQGRHPNITVSRGTPEKGYDYAIKDGDVVAGGLERPNGSRVSGTPGSSWSEIMGARDIGEFWELCEALAPRAMLCNFNSLKCFADWRFRVDPAPYVSPGGIRIDTSRVGELDEWVQQNLVGHKDGVSHTLCRVLRFANMFVESG